MAKLIIDIECGDKTCAIEPGKFCSYLGTTYFGQISICRLFPSIERNDSATKLKDKDGWVQRCDACLAATK